MAAYEVLLLNTSIPQIQAAQAGDTYVVPRDIAFSANTTFSANTANGILYLNASKVASTSSGLTFDGTTATINTLNLTNALGAIYGGTGLTSYTTGDLIYSSATNTLSKLAIGLNTYILTSNGTAPVWAAPSSVVIGTATNLAGGAAGSVPYQSGASTTTFLSIGAANRVMTSTGSAPQWATSLTGLTGVSSSSITNTSLTAGRVVYSTTGGAQTDSAALTFDGTTLATTTVDATNLEVTNIKALDGTAAMSIANSTGVVSVFANPVLSGGTANGVLYLNGSKVATSGSALTFDGTSLGVGAAWTTNPMRSTQPQYFQYGTASTANVIAADGVALFQAMRFSSNNAGAFLILSKGRGTYASPTAVASGDNIGSLDFRVYGGTNSRAVAQINGVVDTYTSDADISSYLSFAVSSSGAAASTEQMRLVTGGKLNIGGNFTSTNNTLQVTGNAAIGYTTAAPTTGLIVAGNVGIGTDSPGVKLEVSGSATAARISGLSATVPQLQLVSGGVVNWSLRANNDGGSDFTIFQDSTQRVKIDSAGTLILRQSSNAANTSVSFNTTVQNALTLDSSGNLGLGTITTTNGRLNVQAGTAATGNSAFFSNPDGTYNPYLQIQHSSAGVKLFNGSSFGAASNNLIFGNAGTSETMRIDGSGNLGIGQTNPSTWLVNGLGIGSGANDWGATIYTGTASTGYLCFADGATGLDRYRGYISYAHATNAMVFATDATERARITSGGNFGIGVTNPTYTLDVTGSTSTARLGKLTITNDTPFLTGANLDAGSNSFALGTSGAGIVAFFSNNTERARITSTGDFGIGTTNPLTKLHVVKTGAGLQEVAYLSNEQTAAAGVGPRLTFLGGASIGMGTVEMAWDGAATTDAYLAFRTRGASNVTERARITSGGYFKASNNGTYTGSTSSYHESYNTASNYTHVFTNTNASPVGLLFLHSVDSNGTGNEFWYCQGNATQRAALRSNGGLANFQANNVNLSDQRTKKDIVAAPSYWDKIKSIEIVHFKYKDQTHDDNNVGVIAQQVEQVAPEFVDQDGWGETPEDGVPLKSIYTSDMYHAAIKALQEAMARIEQLEAKVAALEAK